MNISHDDIVGYTDISCIRYMYNGATLTNICNESKYIIDEKIDIRHIYTKNDYLVAFSSNYSNKNALINFCFLNNKYSVRDFGLYNELPLMFHEYDNINIIDLSNGKIKEHRTHSSEKVIYLDNKKTVTYYKGRYLFYDLSNWNLIKKLPANEIKNGGSYKFETCGDYIFVFDDNTGELINRISIDF